MIYARICFNTKGWQRPSGSEGKARNINTFEHRSGFGFEEWFFDERSLLKDENGEEYQYAYLEGINLRFNQNEDFEFTELGHRPITLFTLRRNERGRASRYIVAVIKKWEHVNKTECTIISNLYPDLITDRLTDLQGIEQNNPPINFDLFRTQTELTKCNFLNLRFKKSDVEYFFSLSNLLDKSHFIQNYKHFIIYNSNNSIIINPK